MIWGNVFKEKPEYEKDGFGFYQAKNLFEGGTVRYLSMKYGFFGALVDF